MSVPPPPTTIEESEFSFRNAGIGLGVGVVLLLIVGQLRDWLGLSAATTGTDAWSQLLREVAYRSVDWGWLFGGIFGVAYRPDQTPVRVIVKSAVKWSAVVGLGYFAIGIFSLLAEMALGKQLWALMFAALMGALLGAVLIVDRHAAQLNHTPQYGVRGLVRTLRSIEPPLIRRSAVGASLGGLAGLVVGLALNGQGDWAGLLLPLLAVMVWLAVRKYDPTLFATRARWIKLLRSALALGAIGVAVWLTSIRSDLAGLALIAALLVFVVVSHFNEHS